MEMGSFLLSEVLFKHQTNTLSGESGLGEVFVIGLVVSFDADSFASLVWY